MEPKGLEPTNRAIQTPFGEELDNYKEGDFSALARSFLSSASVGMQKVLKDKLNLDQETRAYKYDQALQRKKQELLKKVQAGEEVDFIGEFNKALEEQSAIFSKQYGNNIEPFADSSIKKKLLAREQSIIDANAVAFRTEQIAQDRFAKINSDAKAVTNTTTRESFATFNVNANNKDQEVRRKINSYNNNFLNQRKVMAALEENRKKENEKNLKMGIKPISRPDYFRNIARFYKTSLQEDAASNGTYFPSSKSLQEYIQNIQNKNPFDEDVISKEEWKLMVGSAYSSAMTGLIRKEKQALEKIQHNSVELSSYLSNLEDYSQPVTEMSSAGKIAVAKWEIKDPVNASYYKYEVQVATAFNNLAHSTKENVNANYEITQELLSQAGDSAAKKKAYEHQKNIFLNQWKETAMKNFENEDIFTATEIASLNVGGTGITPKDIIDKRISELTIKQDLFLSLGGKVEKGVLPFTDKEIDTILAVARPNDQSGIKNEEKMEIAVKFQNVIGTLDSDGLAQIQALYDNPIFKKNQGRLNIYATLYYMPEENREEYLSLLNFQGDYDRAIKDAYGDQQVDFRNIIGEHYEKLGFGYLDDASRNLILDLTYASVGKRSLSEGLLKDEEIEENAKEITEYFFGNPKDFLPPTYLLKKNPTLNLREAVEKTEGLERIYSPFSDNFSQVREIRLDTRSSNGTALQYIYELNNQETGIILIDKQTGAVKGKL